MFRLPTPSAEALALSQRLLERIQNAITKADGWLAFDSYMDMALYSPGLGYYANGLQKFGEGGDFITAPELGPLFGQCLAWQCHEVLGWLDGGDILECGPGSGQLAVDILSTLKTLDQLPEHYWLLEPSATLAAHQKSVIAKAHPDLISRVHWLEALPEHFKGIMLANEVADAMPLSRFRLTEEGPEEAGVILSEHGLELEWRRLGEPGTSANLGPAMAELQTRYQIPVDYQSELNLRANAWSRALAESLGQGLILIIDYGYSGQEFYHPERCQGTLLCHYQHHSHDEPLLWPGLCDITSSVDFSALAEAARAGGCDSEAFSSQAHFLINTRLDEWLAQAMQKGGAEGIALIQAAKRLTLPNEMGERFRVLGLGKGLDKLPSGFQTQSYSLTQLALT